MGTAVVDLSRLLIGSPVFAFATVFTMQALLFVSAAFLGLRIGRHDAQHREHQLAFAEEVLQGG